MAQDVKERPPETATGDQPWQRLGQEVGNLVGALGHRALSSVAGRVTAVTGRLHEYAEGGEAKEQEGKADAGNSTPPASGQDAPASGGGALRRIGQVVKGVGHLTKGIGQIGQGLTGKGGGRATGSKTKVTNVIETIDIGAPVHVVYNQWTRFEDFPSFLKKVEHVEQESDERLTWKAQILWSHRSWQSEIIEQVPDERIIWRSHGEKGHVDGAVTFHPLGPNLTRVALVLEYYPQGFFEHVGNIWRAQGRRARLELKHFRRHVMTQTLLHPEEVEGWRGTIHEGRTVDGRADEQSAEETHKDREEETGRQREPTGGPGEEQPDKPSPEPAGEQTGDQAGQQRKEPEEPAGGEQGEPAEQQREPAGEQAGGEQQRPAGQQGGGQAEQQRREEPSRERAGEQAGD